TRMRMSTCLKVGVLRLCLASCHVCFPVFAASLLRRTLSLQWECPIAFSLPHPCTGEIALCRKHPQRWRRIDLAIRANGSGGGGGPQARTRCASGRGPPVACVCE